MRRKVNPGSNISSNTLFHFTGNLKNLLNILENGFSPRYCPEYDLDSALFDSLTSKEPPYSAIPIVSFCDLPLSLIKRHLEHYGFYGIGLSKNWGVANNITPVTYIHNSSLIYRNIIARRIFNLTTNKFIHKEEEKDFFSLLSRFMKPEFGPEWRKNKKNPLVYFYDEREWRYVAVENKTLIPIPTIPYKAGISLIEANSNLSNIKLSFKPHNIKYIIVEKEKDILQMINKISSLKFKYSADAIKILSSRIMSVDMIKYDI